MQSFEIGPYSWGEVRKDGVFEVRALGFPPAESREDTR
jgi:hypothetical protein